MSDALGQLLELRLRFRRNPEARALVDRAIALVAKATAADADPCALDLEVAKLGAELTRRFGSPSGVSFH
ncbi:hypothetical protein [Phenylobacterium sp.]|uniref:hypothetical protein n=1 Tax=Phenylobacterium sp. TaxID=1871053 RepID=UPI0035ADAB7D